MTQNGSNKKQLRVLQLGKAYPPVNLGGVEIAIQVLTEGLNDAGITCDALGVNDKYVFKTEHYKNGEIIRAKGLGKYFSTLLSIQLISKLRSIKNNYDVIHIHTPDPMSGLALYLVKPRCKVVLHWHSDILKQKLLLKFYNPILNWLLKRADLVLATSPTYIDGSAYLRRNREKTKALPLGIKGLAGESIGEKSVNNGIDITNKKVIFSLGRLAYYKGYEYLIKAALYLDESFVIIIAGEGGERPHLEQIIQDNSLKNVHLIGHITDDEKLHYYNACSVFCLPSIYKTEAFGIVQLEAMSLGKPLISTKIEGSGVSWVNLDGETGITVDVMNAEQIAGAAKKICGDAVLYNQYSANCRQRFTKFFTQDKMIKDLIDYYYSLL